MRARLITLVMAVLHTAVGSAQHTVSGRVFDQATHEPLEHVGVGMQGGPFTLSRSDGSYTLTVREGMVGDSVFFSLVGYERKSIVVERSAQEHVGVELQAVTAELEGVEVVISRVEERRLGVRSHHALFNYLMEAKGPEEVLEIVQVVDLGPVPLRIKAVNVFVSWSPSDSATFRIGFRGFDGERPTRALVARSIVRKVRLEQGWLRLDLGHERIALSGMVAVTLELLPEPGDKPRSIAYGIRIGGGEKSFDRRTTLDDWNQPPHRYSMNLSAMVPSDRAAEATEDPEPFQRSVDLRMWSPLMADSFSIAFGLPERFDPDRPGGYPTVYLLDANVYFDDVVKAYRKEARKGRMAPVVVVGIGYHDLAAMDSLRQRDLLFPATDGVPESGGAERFHHFMTDQLMPYVDHHYPTDTAHRVLAGHSFGGYFVLFMLCRSRASATEPFQGYIAASPEVAYADEWLFRTFGHAFGGPSSATERVFIGQGDQENDDAMRRTLAMFRSGLADDRNFRIRRYPGADHMGTALPSFTDGVRSVLDGQAE